MGKLIELPTYSDPRGNLTVVEKCLGFEIKRVYYIYNTDRKESGFHKHKKTYQALISVSGSCRISITHKKKTHHYILNHPSICLIIKPDDFHWMDNFSNNSVLLVLASEYYDKNDYIKNGI